MNNINLNQFLQTTILENTTIEPNEFKITFAELVCGEDSKTYKQQFINYLKSPKTSNIKNKQIYKNILKYANFFLILHEICLGIYRNIAKSGNFEQNLLQKW